MTFASFLILFFSAALRLPSPESVKPVRVLEVPNYSEGIVFDHEGNAFISQGKFVTRLKPDGTSQIWAETGAPDGHRVMADDSHLICDDHAAIFHLDKNGKLIGKITEADGKPLRVPNDLALDPKGGFYFTDPGDSGEKPTGSLGYVDPGWRAHIIAGGLRYSNGVVLRPDGKTLLVSESQPNHILEYPVLAPGKLGTPRVFATLPAKGPGQIANSPDGMCLDVDGNLYIAHYGMGQVEVVNPQGKLIRSYRTGLLTTSNVAFGGARMDELYVTGGIGAEGKTPGGLFRLDLPGVRGLTILPSR